VFLHIDRGASSEQQAALRRAVKRPGVELLPQHRTAWASWGIVAAQLEGLRAATARGCSHIAFLSGQDYPLRPPEAIDAFLEERPELSYGATWPLPHRMWGKDGGRHRYRYWHKPIRGRRGFIPVPRRYPSGLKPYGGSMWWFLQRAAARWILRFVDERPDAIRFFRHVWIPDEQFMATVVRNSHLAETLYPDDLKFMIKRTKGAKHPDILVESDVPELVRATSRRRYDRDGHPKLVARKFDPAVDTTVLDRIDCELLRRP
jgi:hypothetical protein